MKYIRLIVIAMLLIGTVFFAWQKYNSLNTPIVIGYIGSLSGKFSEQGEICRNGALFAVEEVNKHGGINGRKLRLKLMDDNSSPELSLAKAKLLADEGVKIIVGPFTSSSATQILDFINKNQILTIGPVIAGENMAGKDDFFVKMYPSTSRFGNELAKLAAHREKLKKLVVVSDNNNEAYSQPIADNFEKKALQLGAETVNKIWFNSAEKISYSQIIDQVLLNNPDGLLVIASPLHTAMIIQQLRIKGSKIQCFSSSWAANKDLIRSGGRAVEGILLFVPFDSKSQNPEFLDFAKRYEARFSSPPSFCSTYNYDSMRLLIRALSRSEEHSPESLRETIISGSPYKGIQSSYTIDKNGDAHHELILQTITNGKFSEVILK